MAVQVIDWFIDKNRVSRQVGMLEELFCPFWKDDRFSFIPPGHVMNHSDHWARRLGMVGHPGVPQADIANDHRTSGCGCLQWWGYFSTGFHDRFRKFDVSRLVGYGGVQVCARPDFDVSII
jgi:hypothetical protein